jgi:hypothetical protein
MSLLRRLQTLSAPKTQDPEYDQALATYKKIGIDPTVFATTIRHLLRDLNDLVIACHKCTAHASVWVSDGSPELQVTMHEIVHNADTFEQLTASLVTARIDPNFIAPLREYEQSVTRLHRKKKERTQARKEYDKIREMLRLMEADKKQKKEKIDQTRAKHDELKRKYDQANADFIQSVNALSEERRTTLANPFKSLSGIFSQYVRAITARSVGPSRREPAGPVRSIGQGMKHRKTIMEAAPNFATLNPATARARSVRGVAPIIAPSIDDEFINPLYKRAPLEEIDDGWTDIFNPVGRGEDWDPQEDDAQEST